MARITRRDFLKFGFTSAAIAGLGGNISGCFRPAPEAGRKVIRPTEKPVTVASTCLLCPAGCGILGLVTNGRLVKIIGNPKHPNNRGRLCSRGHAGINTLYGPDRLLYPLKRSGARGEGRWAQVSWEQALEEIGKRLAPLYQQGKTEAFWVEMGIPGSPELAALHFLKALGNPTIFKDGSSSQENRGLAWKSIWGAETAVSDAAKSRFILIFGANPYEDHEQYIPLVQRVIDGKLNSSAKIVTFDVRLSNTAGKSHEWFPVKPGTDGLIALAMAHHILKQGLEDKQFLRRWANVPASNLAEHLATFTPEQAEKESGVKAADIRRLAETFAQVKPATIITGRGVNGHQNGTFNERCIALLNGVVGNIDIPGGCCLPRTLDLHTTTFKSPFSSSPQALAALKEGKGKPEVYFCYLANPAYANPDANEVAQVLKDEKRLPFFVVADTQVTETGALADLLLPTTSYLESWNLETRPAMEMIPFVSLRQPVVTPLGKSMSVGSTFVELGKRIGGNLTRTFPYESGKAFIAQAAARLPGLAKAGGLAFLQKEGVWFDPAAKPDYRSFEKKGFPTPSGKFEIFSKKLQEKGFPAMPVYVPVRGHQGMKEEEFILTVNRANVMTSRLANAKWLAEILHSNPLWIHSTTARNLNLKDGDRVKVTTKAGSLIARVRLSQGIHPRVVTLTEGLGHSALGNIARAKKVKSSDFDTELLWWEEVGNGVNPSGLIPAEFDPVAGGVAWNDTRVTLTKV
ncbi:MAG: molybdopterin-dependent oxidoreductase [Deltaproteobacteria bacterium]|nr:molybdopterin-dependent oxidoreductase [Deltaproteobacteria bacterium]